MTTSNAATSAREGARHVDGRFGEQERAESGVHLDETLIDVVEQDQASGHPDYSTWAPVDIDTELARLYGEEALVREGRDRSWASIAKAVSREHLRRRWHEPDATPDEVADALAELDETPEADRPYYARSILREHARVEDLDAQIDALRVQALPLDAEFTARGGWTRAFLVVTNGSGHVHRDMHCSTCRPTTRYHWVTEMSDHDEAEIVKAAGERACTICYPSAPVEDLGRPTTLFTPDEVQKREDRAARDEAKREREAKKIAGGLTNDGSEFEVTWVAKNQGHWGRDPATGKDAYTYADRPRRERFKTERAATQWLVQDLAWSADRKGEVDKKVAYDAIVEAIAFKHERSVEDVWAEIDKKVAAKIKRDGG